MFEVMWADPGVEKVGERKARKEKELDGQEGQDARLSKRGSISTRRSSSSAEKSTMTKSTMEKASSLFGSFSLKKNRLSSRSKINHALDLRIPIPEAHTVTPALPTASTFCSTFSSTDFLGEKTSSPKAHPDENRSMREPRDTSFEKSDTSQIISATESLLSASTQVTAPILRSPRAEFTTEPTQPKAKIVQGSGRDTWVAHTPETVIAVGPETGSNCARSDVTLPAERVSTDPHTPTSLISLDENLRTSAFPYAVNDTSPLARGGIHSLRRSRGTVHSKKIPGTSTSRPSTRRMKFLAHDPTRWKAPEDWDVKACDEVGGFNLEEHFGAVTRPGNSSLADLASVQREIKKMSVLVPSSILFRLEEKLADCPSPSAYKETEMEKKRLMLFALGALGGPDQSQNTKATKLLALFETEATASYLAATHLTSSIIHVSPSPLSPLLFPNVRPLISPIVPNPALPVAKTGFSEVYCLPLPSVLPSQDIPGLVRSVHQCLLPGGVLHLILIDPAPAARSLGPRMREWMEDNLLLNLERQFRCTSPRKLIPIWLEDAGLRVDDSAMTTVKFDAVCQKSDDTNKEVKDNKDGGEDGSESLNVERELTDREEQVKLELQSKIGRLLWKETWGNYVNGNEWWWDDPDCAKECGHLGTYWEYSIVKAVKD